MAGISEFIVSVVELVDAQASDIRRSFFKERQLGFTKYNYGRDLHYRLSFLFARAARAS